MAIDLLIQAHPILNFADLDKKRMKKAMRYVGRMVRNEARKKLLVKRMRALHGAKVPGKRYPGNLTGSMRGSIFAGVSRSGRSVGIAYNSTPRTQQRGFYPAFLLYGVRGRIKPFDNPITDTIRWRSDAITDVLRNAVAEAIKTGKV